MLIGTGSNEAAYFGFHFYAEIKRMYQASRHLPDVTESL
jgi:hypothetical protein